MSKSFGKSYEVLKLVEGLAVKHGANKGSRKISYFGVTDTYMDYDT